MVGLIMGAVLGVVSGVTPGPFTTLVAVTALEKGLSAAFRLAFIPLITEGPALLVAVVFLTHVPRGVLQWVGMTGGAVILYLGYRVFRKADEDEAFSVKDLGITRHFWGIAVAMLLSPSPWIFWMLLGGPLFLNEWQNGWFQAGLFLGGFFCFLIGSQMMIAWGASAGRRLNEHLRQRLVRLAAVGLGIAAVVLFWTSYTGDFASLISPQKTIQQAVESEIG
jgi:threonine/homoserine/homoserine lactone efflux protein